MTDLREMLNSIEREARDRHAEIQALEQQIVALRTIHRELHAEIAEMQRLLVDKPRIVALQQAAKQLAESI